MFVNKYKNVYRNGFVKAEKKWYDALIFIILFTSQKTISKGYMP